MIVPTTSDPLGDHILLETVYDRPGKGLDKNTVRCVAPFGEVWLAFWVNFNNQPTLDVSPRSKRVRSRT